MKTKNKSNILIIILIISGGIFYCFLDSIKAYFIPTIEQIGAIKIKIEKDTCYLSSKLTIQNKSFLEIKIDTIKYKVSLFNKAYLQNKELIGLTLNKNSKDTIAFSLKIPCKILMEDLKVERKKRDSTNYSINIFLQYSTMLGKAEMPINKSAKLKIPQPPEIEIVDIKYRKVRIKCIQADVKIKVTNFTDVDLSIKQLNYSMNIANQGSLKGNYHQQINIKPNATTIIYLPIEISLKILLEHFLMY